MVDKILSDKLFNDAQRYIQEHISTIGESGKEELVSMYAKLTSDNAGKILSDAQRLVHDTFVKDLREASLPIIQVAFSIVLIGAYCWWNGARKNKKVSEIILLGSIATLLTGFFWMFFIFVFENVIE